MPKRKQLPTDIPTACNSDNMAKTTEQRETQTTGHCEIKNDTHKSGDDDAVASKFRDADTAGTFVEYLQQSAGPSLTPLVLDALFNSSPTISIRLNPSKPLSREVRSIANEAQDKNEQVPWCPWGFYLGQRPDFTEDPALHAGAYYVQEPSSMFLHILGPLLKNKACNILDLCAAPGGKSTHLLSMITQDSNFTANEVIKSRVAPLRENILKWGNHNAKVVSFDAREICSHALENGRFFDFILVDAPCSGEGMFRKDPASVKEWSAQNVETSAARQKRILSDIWPALAPGGYLAYTTCTFNVYENDQNVEWMCNTLGAEVVDLSPLLYSLYMDSTSTQPAPTASNSLAIKVMEILEKWGIVPAPCGGYRFFPGIAKGEGLFFSLLRKPEEYKESQSRVIINKGTIDALPKRDKGFKPKVSGYKSHLPPPEAALSLQPADNYPTFELSLEQARQYLRCQSITLPQGSPLGMLKLTYGNLPLGYGKNIGTRLNNQYPKNWRIRKQPPPDASLG
jgi:16S rRNA C967 or C1407 C5-methylase (RsmB/RsmF family)/NOL1/NOP2/fmu family ribosome biogenesis protein